MHQKIKTAQKVINDKLKGLLKEDKKLDKDRDRCHEKEKDLKKKK